MGDLTAEQLEARLDAALQAERYGEEVDVKALAAEVLALITPKGGER